MHTSPRHRRGVYAPELLEARIAPATFIVTSILDNGADGTLRKEITDANTAPGADTIIFKLTDPLVPHTIVLNTATGEIPIEGPLTIKGPGIDLLSISGSDLIRIFSIDDGVVATLSRTTISGLTLTDGKTANNGGAIYSSEPLTLKNVVVRSSSAGFNGGGVYVTTDGKTSIVGSHIVHNEAANRGGGLFLRGDAGVSAVKTIIANNTAKVGGGLYAATSNVRSVILIDTCTISQDTATAGSGGGLHLTGVDDSSIIVKNSLVTGNGATAAGGGIYLNGGKSLITRTALSNNTASRGGAIGSNLAEGLSISGSRLIGNKASGGADGGGGAIYLEGTTVVRIAGTLFSRNTSAAPGGAVSHNGVMTMAITGSSFLDNTASGGGAINLIDAAVLTMKSSILTGNITGGTGGAIRASDGSVLNLTGNKFTANRAGAGGAIGIYGLAAAAATANLSGNLFQANVADTLGGALIATEDSFFSSKRDKFIGNVSIGQGGAIYLDNRGGIVITGSLFQSNVAGSSGGGLRIGGDATLTGVKVLDNIAGSLGKGGGIRIAGAGTNVVIAKSLITGNVADDGGGVFFGIDTTTIDAITKVIGNAARLNQNIGSA